MKRLGIALTMMVMLLVGATSAMARDRVVSYEDLPAKAQTTINKHFHKKKIVLVKVDKGYRNDDFEVKFSDGSEVEFNAAGEWTDVKCRPGVPKGIIPQQIRDFLKRNGYTKHGVKVVEISYDRKGYEVELSNGKELSFSPRFRLLEVD